MKVVREHLYEEFSEDSDPIADMGIGWDNLSSEKKWKVPLKERPNHIIDQKQHIYSRGYHLWKLLEYIWKQRDWEGTPTGVRYTTLVKFDNAFRDLPGRRSFSSGTFDMLKRYTTSRDHRYYLDSRGIVYLKRYAPYFDDGKDFSNENDETE